MTQFQKDLEQPLSINGKNKSKGIYNLIISKRDLGLWKLGMKPHRNWKVSNVKKYFGLKGNKEQIYNQIVELVNEHVYNK